MKILNNVFFKNFLSFIEGQIYCTLISSIAILFFQDYLNNIVQITF